MKRCANINGFSLIDVFKTEVHGGSYVFVLSSGKQDEKEALDFIAKEESAGLYDTNTYDVYAKRCHEVSSKLVEEVNRFKSGGYKVVGYGAAAKGNTFLNFSCLDLDYIVDDNKLKWDLYTPGRNILIKNSSCLAEEAPENLVIVPLAWNFFKEIKQRAEQIIGTKVKFIKYFPEVKVL
jgi:hypothetical protein